ncbi:MAG: hypothetical protein IPO21_15090 [Bacteroidales bacterium]|nr:hypothetical protein [Bacteroidales bacterium]
MDVKEIKTMNTFWRKDQPEYLNSLQSITAGDGYLVNMNTAGTLSITGTPISFSNFQIPSFSNWTLLGCPFQTSTPFANYFNSNNCEIIKNFEGFWMPSGTMNTIQNFEPGEAYFIKFRIENTFED